MSVPRFFLFFFFGGEIRNSEKDALHFTYEAKEREKYESWLNFSILHDFSQNYRGFKMGPLGAIEKTIYRNRKTMFDFLSEKFSRFCNQTPIRWDVHFEMAILVQR